MHCTSVSIGSQKTTPPLHSAWVTKGTVTAQRSTFVFHVWLCLFVILWASCLLVCQVHMLVASLGQISRDDGVIRLWGLSSPLSLSFFLFVLWQRSVVLSGVTETSMVCSLTISQRGPHLHSTDVTAFGEPLIWIWLKSGTTALCEAAHL